VGAAGPAAKEGDLGRRKITQWTRYLTLILSILQSMGIAFTLQAQKFVVNPGPSFILMTIITLTTGSIFIMWLGEQITERGVGNGMSLLIFSGIVVGLPKAVVDLSQKARSSAWGSFTVPALLILVAIMVVVVAFIVFMERSERRIPVQYAKRRGWTPHYGRPGYAPAAAREFRRRNAGNFCVVAPQYSADAHALQRL